MNILNHLLSFANRIFFIVVLALTGWQTTANADQPVIAVGPGAPHVPVVRIMTDLGSGDDTISIEAYRRTFTGGVRVAVGDVNGDGVADVITGPGAKMESRVNIFDGMDSDRIGSFLAFPGFYRGGIFVASGDVNGDGRDDIVVGTDSGAPPIVRVFDGRGKLFRSFLAYSPMFTGGVRVATADVNNDGNADIITGAGPGGGPHVKVFDGTSGELLQSFFAYDPTFMGGVFVAGGDFNNDGFDDIVTGAGPGAGPHVKVFDGALPQELSDGVSPPELGSIPAFPGFQGGVRVAVGDVNGDNFDDIIVGAGPGGGPHVKAFDGGSLFDDGPPDVLQSFFAYDPTFMGGVFVGGAGPRRDIPR